MRSLTLLTLSVLSLNSIAGTMTRDTGAPVGDNQNSKTAGPNGPVVLQDHHLIEKLARFDRERIPERVVHARGAGAFGEFVSYGNFSDLTRAQVFSKKGVKTPVFVRFSSVVHSKHSPETLRDPRGFATKFFTKEGNWDLVGNNLPIFFIRDAMKFPDMVHSFKPNPKTNIQESARFLEFFSHLPESTAMLTYLLSNMGTPATFREMDGNSVHAFKFVNKKGKVTYVKFNWKSQQGIKNLSVEEAAKIQGQDFNHMTNDLYTQIEKGNHPSWELQAQLLEVDQLDKLDFNPLDATKEWVRLPGLKIVKLGKMTLNKVPNNFHQSTEQSAFSPSVLVPGIEASEDRLLQGRLFSYPDTQRYRLGANYQMLPINRPQVEVKNNSQDGAMNIADTESTVNFQPNYSKDNFARKNGEFGDNAEYKEAPFILSGTTQQEMIAKTLNFKQAGEIYRGFTKELQDSVVNNMSNELNTIKKDAVKHQLVAHFYCADAEYGSRIGELTKVNMNKVKKICEGLRDE